MNLRKAHRAADSKAGFEHLIQQLRSGDSQAAEQVWKRFVKPLLTVACRHLGDALRAKVDADDVVQSAYRTFFMRLRRGQFELTNWSSMWGLLVRITVRKCARKAEFYHAQQRDVGQEMQMAVGNSSLGIFAADGVQPAPEEPTMMAEIIENLISGLTKPYERQVVYRLLEGWSVQDISADVGRAEYTVRRVVGRIKCRLEQMRDEE